jgi:hypothetical protein
MEFENCSSVNAKTRRRTPAAIRSSTSAFTFSTPASANTTGVVADGVAARLASTRTATLLTGAKRIRDSPRQDPLREVVDHRVHVGAGAVKQADDGGVDKPRLVDWVVRMPTFGLAGCTRSRGRRQPYFRTKAYDVDGEAQTLPSRCARTASVPVGRCRYSTAVITMSLMTRISPEVSR